MKAVKSKKGFTLVEIIIVVAVIAVLTGILVPTFINLNRKANQAKDNSLVANLNTTLKMAEGASGKANETMHETVEVLKAYGYDISVINATSGEDIVWYQNDNQFYLSDKLPGGAKNHELWHIQDNPTTQTYSIYASPKWTATDVVVTAVGFDAGDCTLIETVKYNGSEGGQTAKIRTVGGSLTIDALKDTIWHYGKAGKVKIDAIDPTHSYHVKAEVTGFIEVDQGHVVFENAEYEYKLEPTSENVTVENKATTTVQVFADPELNLDPAKYEGVDVSEEAVVPASDLNEVKTYAELVAAINDVNNGVKVNPLLVLTGAKYDFESRLTITKSLRLVGTPNYTTLVGYDVNINSDDLGHEGAFFIEAAIANQEFSFEGLRFDCFAVYQNRAANIRYVSGVDSDETYSNSGIFAKEVPGKTPKYFIKDCYFYGVNAHALRVDSGELTVKNTVFDGSIQASDSPNLMQLGAWGDPNKGIAPTTSLIANVEGCKFMNSVATGERYDSTGIAPWCNTTLNVTKSSFVDCSLAIGFSTHWAYFAEPEINVTETTFEGCNIQIEKTHWVDSVEDIPGNLEEDYTPTFCMDAKWGISFTFYWAFYNMNYKTKCADAYQTVIKDENGNDVTFLYYVKNVLSDSTKEMIVAEFSE